MSTAPVGQDDRGPVSSPLSDRTGVVVLAAYRPKPELFRRQLETIRDQTRGDFRCLVAADGDVDPVTRQVADCVGSDERFEVLGFEDNVGFYRNVERALGHVPADVGWVALSDQDDAWYPDKLERLVPLLDGFSLASGQARVVRHPSGEVLLERTTRQVLPPFELVVAPQVTGACAVFRRDLLDIALPFPDLDTFTAFHDHWLSVCAVAQDGYTVLDDPVQDYVQHGDNVVGEALAPAPRPLARALRERPVELFRRNTERADRYGGGHAVGQRLRVEGDGAFGWRRRIARTAAERAAAPPPDLLRAARLFDPASGARGLSELLRAVHRSPRLGRRVVDVLAPGIPHELALRVRGSLRPRGRRG